MTAPLPKKVQNLRAALLGNPGHTTPDLRASVAARAAALSGRAHAAGAVPADLDGYIEKVARCAYKVTDEDIATLKAAGYTEDELFEITMSAALGASLARMERGLLALKGGE